MVRSQCRGYHFDMRYQNQPAYKGDSENDRTISRRKRKVDWWTFIMSELLNYYCWAEKKSGTEEGKNDRSPQVKNKDKDSYTN